jgi:hypothetical protein
MNNMNQKTSQAGIELSQKKMNQDQAVLNKVQRQAIINAY